MKQREIRFRAWSPEEQIMIIVDVLICLADGSFKVCYSYKGDKELHSMFDPVVMEFTGLLDKNGKEIYEFDILKSNAGRTGQVVYEFGAFQYLGDPLSYDFEDGCSITETTEWAEIIGNIYQNPDLLK